jgi:hypothetical protein
MAYYQPALLCDLIRAHPRNRFVLMHTGYPHGGELIALAKHYPQVYLDFCWAWSIDTFSTRDFLRRCLRAVPANKLFIFGGDTFWPMASLAFATQARRELLAVLEAEVADQYLTERDAMRLANRWMHDNQYACFDIAGRRAAIRDRLPPPPVPVAEAVPVVVTVADVTPPVPVAEIAPAPVVEFAPAVAANSSPA